MRESRTNSQVPSGLGAVGSSSVWVHSGGSKRRTQPTLDPVVLRPGISTRRVRASGVASSNRIDRIYAGSAIVASAIVISTFVIILVLKVTVGNG